MGELKVITGGPAVLREQLADRVRELRATDPLAPITLLVGASLQRPFLERWLAARLGAHANVRILMPGDLALLLGAPALVDQERRALPPLADRVLLAQVARLQEGYFEPVREMPGFGEALYRLVRELKGAGYDLSNLGPSLEGATDAPEKAGSLAELLAAFEARRREFYGPDDALLAAEPERLGGLGLLVWGMLDLPPALERLVRRDRRADAVDVFAPDVPAAADAPLAEALERLIAAGATLETHTPAIARPGTALDRVRAALFTAPDGAADRARRNPAAGVGAGPVPGGASGRTGVPSVGAGGPAILGDGGCVSARRRVPATGGVGVHRGGDPGVPARGLAAGGAPGGPPDAGAARPVRDATSRASR